MQSSSNGGNGCFFAAVLSSGGTCAMGNGWGNGAKAARVFGGGTVTTAGNGLPKNNAEGGLFLWPLSSADMPRQVAHKRMELP